MQNVHEKWMAAISWLVTLIALVISSVVALNVLGYSGFNQLFLAVIQNQATGNAYQIITYLCLLLILLGVGFLLMSWLRFANLTNEVMIALSAPRDDEEPIFSNFLQLSDTGKSEAGAGEVYEAKGSLFGDVIRLLAIAWMFLLVVSPLIHFAQ